MLLRYVSNSLYQIKVDRQVRQTDRYNPKDTKFIPTEKKGVIKDRGPQGHILIQCQNIINVKKKKPLLIPVKFCVTEKS